MSRSLSIPFLSLLLILWASTGWARSVMDGNVPRLTVPVQSLQELRQNRTGRLRVAPRAVRPQSQTPAAPTRQQPAQPVNPRQQFQAQPQRRQPTREQSYDLYQAAGSFRSRAQRNRDDRLRAALLLPLTGKHSELGQAMLQAAELAAFDVGGDQFDLMPRDTRGSAIGAKRAAQEALQDGADIILGPLFGEEARIVLAEVRRYGVPVLSFSNDWTLTEDRGIVLGFQPQNQVERILRFAKAQPELQQFAILAPSNPYGEALVAAAVGVLGAPGQEGSAITFIGRYDPDRPALSGIVRDLARTPYDAMLIGDGGQSLLAVTEALTNAGFQGRGTRYLGPGLWGRITSQRVPLLYGAWYAAPDPERWNRFVEKMQVAFDSQDRPTRVATLAYDATALVAVLARRHNQYDRSSDPYSQRTLKRQSGFQGTDGLFRIRSNGLVERSLAVLQIGPDGGRVLDPAPASFDRDS